MVIARAEAGEWQPVLLDLALFCAMASVRPDDCVDHARFARLLRHELKKMAHQIPILVVTNEAERDAVAEGFLAGAETVTARAGRL